MDHLSAAALEHRRQKVYPERARLAVLCAILELFGHAMDRLAPDQGLWLGSVAARVAWAALLLGFAVALRRGGPDRIQRWAAAVLVGSSILELVLVWLSGGVQSAQFPFLYVLAAVLPCTIAESRAAGLVGSAVLMVGASLFAVLGPSHPSFLAWHEMGAIVFAFSWAVSRAVERSYRQLEDALGDLTDAHATVRTLKGLLPICAWCRRVRDDAGYWERIEAFLPKHSDAVVTHAICPECARKADEQLDRDG